MSENMYDAWDNGDRHAIRQQFARREKIIRMAREAGKTKWFGTHPDGTSDFLGAEFSPEQLERFATLVAAAEREACAKLCEEPGWNAANWCAKQIRARGRNES